MQRCKSCKSSSARCSSGTYQWQAPLCRVQQETRSVECCESSHDHTPKCKTTRVKRHNSHLPHSPQVHHKTTNSRAIWAPQHVAQMSMTMLGAFLTALEGLTLPHLFLSLPLCHTHPPPSFIRHTWNDVIIPHPCGTRPGQLSFEQKKKNRL